MNFLQFARLILLLALAAPSAFGSSELTQELTQTLHRIFGSHEFDAKSFGPARWIEDGKAYTTLELAGSSSDVGKDIVRYDTASGTRTVLVSASQLVPAPGAKPLEIDDYAWSADNQRLLVFTNTKKVWRQNTRGDYWMLELAGGKPKKLGGNGPESSLMFAKFSPDGKSVAWVRANNIYLENLSNGKIRPLTKDGSETRINGTSDWVNEEELDIRDGFQWSPDGHFIAYWQFDTSGVGEYTLINDTETPYPALHRFAYPQPGTKNSAVRLGVVEVSRGPTRWVQTPGDPREHYIFRVDWAPNSQELAVEYLNRLQNSNQILLADARSGKVRVLLEDTDKAWVDVLSDFHWFDAKSFGFLSERDGWRHAYLFSRESGQVKLLTSAAADVIAGVAVDEKAGWFYYIASPSNATQRYLYRTRLAGQGEAEQVTPSSQAGTHSYDISPDGRWAFHTYSSFDRPPVIDLVSLPEHKSIRALETNAAAAEKAKELIAAPAEFFQVAVNGGARLDGWMIKPRGFDPAKKYPVLVFVYGEVASCTVNDRWGGREALFHRAIANDGYLVVSFDNQGTPAPKGRAWRKVVYGTVGILSSQQQAAAIAQLMKDRPYVDGSRLAIWGWSGGGTNTLNVMFRSPGLFAAGMAVAPVADLRYYDSTYQERYMGVPAENAKGYHDASTINIAEGLAGKLLIVHGSGDDNVHFQGTEMLMNKLIQLGKPFDFMDYPNRTHAISEGPGTSEHLRQLLARYLEEHVAPGGVQ
jgi:dipeptidyl-peptidase-4